MATKKKKTTLGKMKRPNTPKATQKAIKKADRAKARHRYFEMLTSDANLYHLTH